MIKRAFGRLMLLVVLLVVAVTVIVLRSGDPDFAYQSPQPVVNDVTQLNPIAVRRVVAPESLDDIVAALTSSTGKVSVGGGRFSQGGQTGFPDSLHLDMRRFNRILELDVKQKRITVQSGATWRDIQEYIDPYDLSVSIMQTYANFTVGGSLSVNAHGRYIGEGPLVHSVESIKLILADGRVIIASPQQNRQLFYGAIGGYGGLGVIAEATLRLADNTRVKRHTTPMAIEDYYSHFLSEVRGNPDVVFHNADIYPPDYSQVRDVSWYRSSDSLTNEERLTPRDKEYWLLPKLAQLVAAFDWGKGLRQHIIDPLLYRKDSVVWRNREASYDVAELEPASREKYSYVLREYFIPVARFDEFVPKMRDIFRRHKVNVLNVSIRHAYADPDTLLSWAREEVFAFVVYYRQGTSRQARQAVGKWSREMIDAAIESGGAYYLPYQVYADGGQFRRAYPNADAFFTLKDQFDPGNRFINTLWAAHYPKNRQANSEVKAELDQYYRAEEQTFLTVPEWYLVFNPQEYADFLESGNNPSDFPFMASIDEYWTQYDRVRAIAANYYPENEQYLTVLRVIGISTTLEYAYKGLYENTLGRATRWLANGEDTPEDKIIQQAQRAYSKLIFDKAWYEFEFWPWVEKIWREPEFWGANFPRKLERKISFSLEYGFKTLYAKLIEYGAKSTYEQSNGLIYLSVSAAANPAEISEDISVLAREGDDYLISVPRWGRFSELLPMLARAGVRFNDISGNRRIVVAFVIDADQAFESTHAEQLFTSRIVSRPELKRIVSAVEVSALSELIAEAEAGQYRIEHIYDY
jgi:FAD/FMN-containing dehydrogenase